MDFSDFDDLFPPGALDGILDQGDDLETETEEQDTIPERRIWTVSELLQDINQLLDMEYGSLWIQGEIGRVSVPPSGHRYFPLKDQEATVRSVCFKGQSRTLAEHIKEGAQVLCLGRLNVYQARGDLQVIVDHLEPWGLGRLKLEFERLKRKLEEEGLFDPSCKRQIPSWPENVYVITSPSGAAIRDLIKASRRRFPGVRIKICPCQVQGEQAPEELIKAIDLAEAHARPGDVIVITRGGGSLEDLWAFNSEALARRIFACEVPVISAVGHEIDFTICDFVADARAATPTAAADLICPDVDELIHRLESSKERLISLFKTRVMGLRHQLKIFSLRLKHPRHILIEQRLRLDELHRQLVSGIQGHLDTTRMELATLKNSLLGNNPGTLLPNRRLELLDCKGRLRQAITQKVQGCKSTLSMATARLQALSPLSCMEKGFSLVFSEDGQRLITDAGQVSPGSIIKVDLPRGGLVCKVLDKIDDERREG